MEIAVVVDTNVVFASLIRSGGVNRYVLTLFPEMFSFFYPEVVRKEIANHIDELAKKSKLTPEELSIAMEVIFEPMTPVSAIKLSRYKAVAEKYVHDVADAPFVACALMLKSEYDEVVILTWNISDYIVEKLAERGIWVMTPLEFLKWVKEKG